MSNNVLPNLSEWFEVPVGATVPAYTTYTVLWGDGSHTTAHGENEPFMVEYGVMYFTEEPIEAPKNTLEDVIRDAGTSVTDIAKAVEAFYAEQKQKQKPEQPRVIIDNDSPGKKWLLNAEGTYDWALSHPESITACYSGYTRERIEKSYGIKEERY